MAGTSELLYMSQNSLLHLVLGLDYRYSKNETTPSLCYVDIL